MNTPTATLRLLKVLILTSLVLISPVWAQQDDSQVETTPPASDTPAEARLERIRESMTARLARKRLSEVASDFAIKVDNTAPRVRTWTADSGIELRLRFMVHPRRRRALIDTVNREVMQAFSAAADVDFAYNTLRVIPTPQEPDS